MIERRIQNKKVETGKYGVNNLFKAGLAVARGPVSLHPDATHSKDYIEKYKPTVDSTREDLFNPDWATIKKGIASRTVTAIEEYGFNSLKWNNLPWDNPYGIRMDRLAGTIVSFSDDHQIPLATEFFPVDNMLEFLHQVKERYNTSGEKQNVIDQFDIAMTLSDNHPIGAAVIAHGAYRSVARVMEKRVDDRLSFPVISEKDEIALVSFAESTAHFEDPTYTDPLGDTYHWWGQLLAGTVFELSSSDSPIRAEAYRRAFYYGPPLMTIAREKIKGRKMVGGDHREIDRQALSLGKQIGELISSYQNK